MEFIKVAEERRSIRKYSDKAVTREEIEKVISIARFAPSWKNSQTVRYHAVLDRNLKDRIAEEGTMNFSKNMNNIKSASALIVLTSVNGIAGYNPDGSFTTNLGTHWQSFDAGIACQTFCLTAYSYGLSTLIMGIFNAEKIAELIRLPENESISALIAVGYPDEQPTAPQRKSIEEIAEFI